MKKSIAILALLSASFLTKAQTPPANVSIPLKQITDLYSRIDTVTSWLQQSELKGNQITWLISKLQAGTTPISLTINARLKAIKDSTDKAKAKPVK